MPLDATVAQEQWDRFVYCRDNGHFDFLTKADKCDKFFAGKQWEVADVELLKSQRRPALTINKIISTISTILGEQIYNRTEVLFRPKNGAPAEIADALCKVWMQISQNNQLPWLRSEVFCDGIIRSRGFYDVRLDFEDSMRGEIKITLANGKNVVVDPDAEEFDPDSWADCFTTKWMTSQDIATLYSESAAKELKDRAGSGFQYGYDSIEHVRDRFAGPRLNGSYHLGQADPHGVTRNIRVIERQYRKLDKMLHFVDVETGDMRPVPVSWDRDRISLLLEKAGGRISTLKKLIRRIKWTVTADSLVLHDDWSPYKHFTLVPYFPFFRYGETLGIVEHLLGPQEILNKASSQELHVVNTTANSGWKIEENSLANMTTPELEARGAQTGLVIVYKKGSTPPEKITPNHTPTGLDRITYKAEEHIKTISNVSDSMQGFDREDVAAKAIAYKQQRGSVNLTKVLDNLERSDYILARNVLDIVQEYYTEPRLVTITHDDFAQEQEQINVNQVDPTTGEITNNLTLGEYDIVITSSPYRASLEDSQFEQARALKELGLPIPDRVLIENSRLLRRNDIVKDMEAAQNSPQAQKQAELQMRGMEADVALKEADVGKKRAETAQKGADAQIKANEAAGGQDGELQKMQEELQLERERLDMELQKMREELVMKWEEMQQKLQMQREEHAQSQELKAQEHAQNMELREQQAEQQAVAQRAAELRGDADNNTADNNPA